MSTGQGNIFFNMESLAFSMPLILVCGTYAYFNYVPLSYGLPILGGLFVLFQIRSQIQAHRENKIQNMDDKAMSDLVSELQGDGINESKAAAKKKLQLKKKAQVEQRLAAERKKNNKNKNKVLAEGDDDDDNLATFAKVAKNKKN